jgi:hypothetical protein
VSLLGRLTAQANRWVGDVRHRLGWPATKRIEHRPESGSDEARPFRSNPATAGSAGARPAPPPPPGPRPPFPPPGALPQGPPPPPPAWAPRPPFRTAPLILYHGRFAAALVRISARCDALVEERALSRIAAVAGRDPADLRRRLAGLHTDRLVGLAAELRHAADDAGGEIGATQAIERLLLRHGVPPPGFSGS